MEPNSRLIIFQSISLYANVSVTMNNTNKIIFDQIEIKISKLSNE